MYVCRLKMPAKTLALSLQGNQRRVRATSFFRVWLCASGPAFLAFFPLRSLAKIFLLFVLAFPVPFIVITLIGPNRTVDDVLAFRVLDWGNQQVVHFKVEGNS
jgi:hypothetical protein